MALWVFSIGGVWRGATPYAGPEPYGLYIGHYTHIVMYVLM